MATNKADSLGQPDSYEKNARGPISRVLSSAEALA